MRFRLFLGLAAALLVLTGCSGGAAAPPPVRAPSSAPEFNAADVMFLQMMIPHHEQGVEIVRLARDHQVRPAVAELAAAIEATQRSEAEDMKGWLRDWGQPATADASAHAGHGGMPMTSPDLIGALKSAPGAEFERRFLDILAGHQHQAVEMSQTETSTGKNPAARDLAHRIVESRTAEIKQLLGYTTT
ncbi:DUF305 domain-containing protein [Amycolatopsis samaneae]